MEGFSSYNEQKPLQLTKGSGNTLEKILGVGNDIFLKVGVGLDSAQAPLNREQREVPVRLFFTDCTFCPISHTAVDFNVKVDCEPINPTCIFPGKPQSFDSCEHFTNWLNQGCFMQKNMITYNFPVDVQKIAPSLTL